MKFYVLLILTVSWFAFMTCLSHQNGVETRETSGRLTQEVIKLFHVDGGEQNVDKVNNALRHGAHVAVFAILTILVLATVDASASVFMNWVNAWSFIGAMGFVAFWSWCDEATKIHIDGRHFSWFDVGLNLAGLGIGAGFCAIVGWILCWRER